MAANLPGFMTTMKPENRISKVGEISQTDYSEILKINSHFVLDLSADICVSFMYYLNGLQYFFDG